MTLFWLGQSLSRDSRFEGLGQSIIDIWLSHVMPAAIPLRASAHQPQINANFSMWPGVAGGGKQADNERAIAIAEKLRHVYI